MAVKFQYIFSTVLPTLSWKYLSWKWFGCSIMHCIINSTSQIFDGYLLQNLREPIFTEKWKIEKITWHGRAERGTLNNHFDGKMFLPIEICTYRRIQSCPSSFLQVTFMDCKKDIEHATQYYCEGLARN